MNSVKSAAIILFIACFGASCANSDAPRSNPTQPSATPATAVATATPDPLVDAYADFEKNCKVCHGEKGDGGTVVVEGKKLKVPSLREGHVLKHTDERLVKQITEGDEEMPAFKEKLSPSEINDLVKFIRKEFQGK